MAIHSNHTTSPGGVFGAVREPTRTTSMSVLLCERTPRVGSSNSGLLQSHWIPTPPVSKPRSRITWTHPPHPDIRTRTLDWSLHQRSTSVVGATAPGPLVLL